MRHATDLDFLLHPLVRKYMPNCSTCGAAMQLTIVATSVNGPDVSMFVCPACHRSERRAIEDAPLK
jgi:transposase-like protein